MSPSRRRDDDLRDEVRAHLDMAERDRREGGQAPTAARDAARREFGNVDLVMETTRDVWQGAPWSRLVQDARYGLRLLARTPVVTAAALLSLALGVGANVAIFSVIDALMLRPLPVRDPGALYGLTYTDTPVDDSMFAYPSLAKYRGARDAFAEVAAVSDIDRSNLVVKGSGSTDPVSARISMVSGNYFGTLGVGVERGRALGDDDDRPAAAPAAVISDAFWTGSLGRRTEAIGTNLELNGTTFTIVGIAPAGFVGVWPDQPAAVWVPIAFEDAVWSERPGLLSNPNPPWIQLLVRLQPGLNRAQAEAAANPIFLTGRDPAKDSRLTAAERQAMAQVRLVVAPVETGLSFERRLFAEPLFIVGIVAGLVLLIACSNVANLLLARAAGRSHELAVRVALGAGARRLFTQLLTESLLLSAGGGLLGSLAAWWGVRTLTSILDSGLDSLEVNASLDWRVLTFALVVTVGTGLLFGLLPALRASKTRIAGALTTRRQGGSGSRFGVPEALVVWQIAMSIVLVVSAALFIQTLANLRRQDLGFERDRLLQAVVPVSQTGRKGAPVARVFEAVQERAAALPAVTSVSASSDALLNGEAGGSPIIVVGHPHVDSEDWFVPWNLVMPRFFETVGQKMLAGRDFSRADDEHASRVAIINESMARYYWGGLGAVGRRFGMRRDTGNEIEIVGVVADAAYTEARTKPTRMIYLPYRQDLAHLDRMTVVVRTSADPAAAAALVRSAIRAVDRSLPVRSVATIQEQLDHSLVEERLIAGLAGGFGIVGALLTSIGLFGVVAYATARRTNEIGIRLALGASRSGLVTGVLSRTLLLTAGGITLGIPIVAATTRLISARLFGIGAADPATIAASAAGMLALAAVAAAVPATRAARVDPVVALRTE